MSVELAHSWHGDRDRPVLVMSSALGTSMAMWDAQHPLGEHYSLLLYDHRGLGASPAPPGPYSVEDLGTDLLMLLDALGIESASFCGVSLGGMVGLWLAAHHPKRIRKLVVMSTLARLQPSSRYLERAAAVRAQGMGPIASSVVARWFTERFAREHPEVIQRFVDQFTAMNPEGYAGCCEALADCDLRADIQEIPAPTLVVAGADDPIVPASSAVLFAASFRDAEVAVVPDAAHLENVERPDIVNRLVYEHLSDADGGVA
jgi:3-oxoadipate enol-lactonase